jgi:hypothetical protein
MDIHTIHPINREFSMAVIDKERLERLLVDRFTSDRDSGFLVKKIFPNCPAEVSGFLEFVAGGCLRNGGIAVEGSFSFDCFLSITSSLDYCNLFWRWRASGSPANKIPFALSLGNGDYFVDAQTGVISVDYPDDPRGGQVVSVDLISFVNSIEACDIGRRRQIEYEVDRAKRLRGFLEIADDESVIADLRGGCPTSALSVQGWSILQWAGIQNRVRVLDFLFSEGVARTEVDGIGNTLLHLAASNGSLDVLRALRKSSRQFFLENLDAVNQNGETPLWQALACGRTRCAVFLAVSGADLRKQVRAEGIDEWFKGNQWRDWNEYLEKGLHQDLA